MLGPINIKRVQSVHATLLRDLDRVLETQAELAGESARGFVESRHPGFSHRTRQLSKSTEYRVARTRGGKIIKIRNTAPHAAAIDKGSRPHVIRAKNGGMLRFVVNGRVMFRRKVNHPGTKPTHFLKKATHFAYERFGRHTSHELNLLSARFKRAR